MTQSVLGGSWTPFTRGIQSDPFTVYGVFVNGYNVVATTTSSSSTSSSTPSSVPASITPSTSAPASSTSITSTPSTVTSSGLSSGAAAGISIGVAAAVILVAILAFFLYRRRRNTNQQIASYPREPVMRQEMESQNKTSDLYNVGGPLHELPLRNPQMTYELH